jgi:hypothetical protein
MRQKAEGPRTPVLRRQVPPGIFEASRLRALRRVTRARWNRFNLVRRMPNGGALATLEGSLDQARE